MIARFNSTSRPRQARRTPDETRLGHGRGDRDQYVLTLFDNPAFWSAIAAAASAAAAWLSLRTNRRSLRESFRPVLDPGTWDRGTRPGVAIGGDTITFRTVVNTGRGLARGVVINAHAMADDDRPMYFMSSLRLPIIAPGATVQVPGEISLIWKNVPAHGGHSKSLGVVVRMDYWDTVDMYHRAETTLLVNEDLNHPFGLGPVARGVGLINYQVSSEPIWRRRIRHRLGRLPGFGRWIDLKR